MLTAIGLMTLGLAALVLGGESLVRGASRLAALAGVSPLVIGLTVVSFGTSAPELAVSLKASLAQQTDLAVGNVVGSNIFNVLFILGVSALIVPLTVDSKLIWIDVPLMIVASFMMLILGLDGSISRWDGIGLFAALVCYTVWTVVASRKETKPVQQEFETEYGQQAAKTGLGQIGLQCAFILAGLVLLTFGAKWLVDGSVTIARIAGMSELLIGLTIVAVGTSLPEVAASIVASIRGERDIAVGNVVGSNIFNITCVLGLSASLMPNGIGVSSSVLRLDLPVMIAVALACLPIFITGHRISRWEGGIFLGFYLAYTTYVVLDAVMPSISRTFGFAMVVFVAPLTVITFVLSVVRSLPHRAR